MKSLLRTVMAAIDLKLTFRQSARLFLRTAAPYKDFDYFNRYLLTVHQVTVEKDVRTVSLYRLYGTLLAYFCLLNLAHYFLPHSHYYFLRVLTCDCVTILAMDGQFSLVFAGLAAYSLYLSWRLYFRVNPAVHSFYQNAIQEATGGGSSKDSEAILGPQAAFFRQLLLVGVNSLQVFVFLLDVNLAIVVPTAVTVFIRLTLSTLSSLADFINLGALWTLFGQFLLLLLLPVHLFHVTLHLAFWYNFGHCQMLQAVNGMTSITALFFLFGQNYRRLRRALVQLARRAPERGAAGCSQGARSVKSLACQAGLISLLRRNAAHFRLVFAYDRYYGRLYALLLGLHVPTSAYFTVQLLLRSDSLSTFSLPLMICLVGEAFTGTLLVHLYGAHFTGYIHRSGKWLLGFSASTLAFTQAGSVLFSSRERLLLWIHINRLVVKRRYGITYAGLGLMSMSSFFQFILLYAEFFMYYVTLTYEKPSIEKAN